MLRGYKKLAIVLVFFQIYLSTFLFLDYGFGLARGLLVAGLIIGLALLRFGPQRYFKQGSVSWCSLGSSINFLKIAVILAVTLNVGIAAFTLFHCFKSNKIPLDVGQTTWRSARLLWKGENPYGRGAVVDFACYKVRAEARRAENIIADIQDQGIDAALALYDKTLDPGVRAKLLPVNIGTSHSFDETRITGYKYGPVILDVTALFVPLGQPSIVVLLNALMCFILYWAMSRLLLGISPGPPAAIGILAILLDRIISWNYLGHTATDVWALAFCSLGVLTYCRGKPLATAALLAIALGCKIFPSLIFFPLLLKFRSVRPLFMAGGVFLAICAPWIAWDPIGIFSDVLMWPFVMSKDTTSWTYFAAPQLLTAARLCALVAIGLLWLRYITRREQRLFWTLAMVNTLLLAIGGVLHNNYVPWASIWIVAAIVESFSLPREIAAGNSTTAFAPEPVLRLPADGQGGLIATASCPELASGHQ